MAQKGSTYTIVVDDEGNIVSSTRNGVLMTEISTEKKSTVIPVDGEVRSGELKKCTICGSIRLKNLPEGVEEHCILFGMIFKPPPGEPDCTTKWGKLI